MFENNYSITKKILEKSLRDWCVLSAIPLLLLSYFLPYISTDKVSPGNFYYLLAVIFVIIYFYKIMKAKEYLSGNIDKINIKTSYFFIIFSFIFFCFNFHKLSQHTINNELLHIVTVLNCSILILTILSIQPIIKKNISIFINTNQNTIINENDFVFLLKNCKINLSNSINLLAISVNSNNTEWIERVLNRFTKHKIKLLEEDEVQILLKNNQNINPLSKETKL